MPISQNILDFIEIFKADFEEFFKDKYFDENHRIEIYSDIINLIRNKYVNQIYFVSIPMNESTIQSGYLYTFDYNENTETDIRTQKIQTQMKKGEERILVIDFSDNFLKESIETKEIVLNNLNLNWDYFPEIQELEESHKNMILKKRDLRVSRSNIQ